MDSPNLVARTLTVFGVLTKSVVVNTDLTLGGNLVVQGTGQIDLDGVWRIRFLVPTETQYAGGGDVCGVVSDVGLWVCEGGRLTVRGAAKSSWTSLVGGASAGQQTITVRDSTGWLVGDEISITPTESTLIPGFVSHYDERTITAIQGSTVTLNMPLTWNHPAVTVRPGVTLTAEVMNLTRSGRIEGQDATHRAHIWIRNVSPTSHIISYISLRYLAPQQFDTHDAPPPGQVIENLGRYPLHFHKNGDFSSGTQVVGVVVRNFGMHAMVPHDSNGITFRDNVMHDGYGDAHWWDNAVLVDRCSGCPRPDEPRGLQILHNIASKLNFIPSFRGFIMTGFFVGRQNGNVYRDNVAVGINGNATCSGFSWPEFSHGVADFGAGNLAHNTNCTGLFAWQNDSLPHVIRDFTAYHNRFTGILHGAYVNLYRYENITLYANGDGSDEGSNIELHAMSQPPADPSDGGAPQLRFVNVYMDAAGRPWNIKTAAHAVAGSQPVRFSGGTLTGASRANVNLAATPTISGSLEDWLQVDADVSMAGNRFWINDNVDPNSRVVDVGLRLTIRPRSATCAGGVVHPEWNAVACP